MIAPVLVLAASVIAAGGRVPIPESVVRFPDPSWWPGGGVQQEVNMLEAIRIEAGEAMRWAGPGPAQLQARYSAGRLDKDERVSALLAGGTWHDPGLIRLYADVLTKGSQRERQAALVGLMWTIGAAPPPIVQWPTTIDGWKPLAGFARRLETAVRERTLVGIWVDSFLDAGGLPHRSGFLFHVPAERCLGAIREIARAEDFDEVLVLWPLLTSESDRFFVMRTVEAITAARFGEPVPEGTNLDPTDFARLGVERLDRFVGSLCRPADGLAAVMSSLRNLARQRPEGGISGAAWEGLRMRYPYVWPALTEVLVAYGAPAVTLFRQWPLDPRNRDAVRRLTGHFPISSDAAAQAPRRGRR